MKVLLAKVGLDGHDRGVKVIRDALINDGIDTIYIGLHKTPEDIVDAAIKEKVDAVGISSMTGAHNLIFQRIFELMKARGVNIPTFAGGIIPDEDIPKLKEMGVKEVFSPGTELDEIAGFVRGLKS